MHGCLLRLDRPTDIRSYLVDPRFAKRADAKSAVCLIAMSQGIGNYIRAVRDEIENRLPVIRRRLANERIIPTITHECHKAHALRPEYIFDNDRDGTWHSITHWL